MLFRYTPRCRPRDTSEINIGGRIYRHGRGLEAVWIMDAYLEFGTRGLTLEILDPDRGSESAVHTSSFLGFPFSPK